MKLISVAVPVAFLFLLLLLLLPSFLSAAAATAFTPLSAAESQDVWKAVHAVAAKLGQRQVHAHEHHAASVTPPSRRIHLRAAPGGVVDTERVPASVEPHSHDVHVASDAAAAVSAEGQQERERLYLVQFSTFPSPAVLADAQSSLGLATLSSSSSSVIFVAYIPDNAYVVRATPAAARQLMSLSMPSSGASVLWVGPYIPSYKMSPSLNKTPKVTDSAREQQQQQPPSAGTAMTARSGSFSSIEDLEAAFHQGSEHSHQAKHEQHAEHHHHHHHEQQQQPQQHKDALTQADAADGADQALASSANPFLGRSLRLTIAPAIPLARRARFAADAPDRIVRLADAFLDDVRAALETNGFVAPTTSWDVLTEGEKAARDRSARMYRCTDCALVDALLVFSERHAVLRVHAKTNAQAVADALVTVDSVLYVDLVPVYRLLNDAGNAVLQNHAALPTPLPLWDRGIMGQGQIVSVSDTGLDADNCFFRELGQSEIPYDRLDTSRRKIISYRVFGDRTDQIGGHGSHVCGSAVGECIDPNARESQFNGVARKAKIAFADIGDAGGGLQVPENVGPELLGPSYGDGARVFSASWGSDTAEYTEFEANIDEWLYTHPDAVFLVANGNAGSNGAGTVGAPATAKNVIGVGAARNAPWTTSAAEAEFGPKLTVGFIGGALAANVVSSNAESTTDSEACGEVLNADELKGKVAIVDRGHCFFIDKAKNVQKAGAIAMIVVNTDDGLIRLGGTDEEVKIPALMITKTGGSLLRQLMLLSTAEKPRMVRMFATVVEVSPGDPISSFQDLAFFSSLGPTDDGRIKPEIVAPGMHVISAFSDGDLTTKNCGLLAMMGTSMATPLAAGATALVRQYLNEGWFPSGRKSKTTITPRGIDVKALMLHSGERMTGNRESGGVAKPLKPNYPSFEQGFGLVHLGGTLYFRDDDHHGMFLVYKQEFGVSAFTYHFRADRNIKATLTWYDPAGVPMSSKELTYDLDLEVTVGTKTYVGNHGLNGDVKDSKNNNEMVFVELEQPTDVHVTVKRNNAPADFTQWSMVVTSPDLQLPGVLSLAPLPSVMVEGRTYSIEWRNLLEELGAKPSTPFTYIIEVHNDETGEHVGSVASTTEKVVQWTLPLNSGRGPFTMYLILDDYPVIYTSTTFSAVPPDGVKLQWLEPVLGAQVHTALVGSTARLRWITGENPPSALSLSLHSHLGEEHTSEVIDDTIDPNGERYMMHFNITRLDDEDAVKREYMLRLIGVDDPSFNVTTPKFTLGYVRAQLEPVSLAALGTTLKFSIVASMDDAFRFTSVEGPHGDCEGVQSSGLMLSKPTRTSATEITTTVLPMVPRAYTICVSTDPQSVSKASPVLDGELLVYGAATVTPTAFRASEHPILTVSGAGFTNETQVVVRDHGTDCDDDGDGDGDGDDGDDGEHSVAVVKIGAVHFLDSSTVHVRVTGGEPGTFKLCVYVRDTWFTPSSTSLVSVGTTRFTPTLLRKGSTPKNLFVEGFGLNKVTTLAFVHEGDSCKSASLPGVHWLITARTTTTLTVAVSSDLVGPVHVCVLLEGTWERVGDTAVLQFVGITFFFPDSLLTGTVANVTFEGFGLSAADSVKIVEIGDECTVPTTAPGSTVGKTTFIDAGSVVVPITLDLSGTFWVCYYLNATASYNRVGAISAATEPHFSLAGTLPSVIYTGAEHRIEWIALGPVGSDVTVKLLLFGVPVDSLFTGAVAKHEFVWHVKEYAEGLYALQFVTTSSVTTTTDPFIIARPSPPLSLSITGEIVKDQRIPIGSTATITWEHSCVCDDGAFVGFSLYNGDAEVATLGAARLAAGTFEFMITDRVPPGGGYHVHVQALSQPSMMADTPEFVIIPPGNATVLTLHGPVGEFGGTVRRGDVAPLHWFVSGQIGPQLVLDLYVLDSKVRTIATLPTAALSYEWHVAMDLGAGSDYHLRLTDSSNPSTVAESPTFTIADPLPGTIRFTGPFGPIGAIALHGRTLLVEWATTGMLSDKLQLRLIREGNVVRELVTVPTTTTSFQWTVDPSIPPLPGYQLRLNDLKHPDVLALSPMFEIQAPANINLTAPFTTDGATVYRNSLVSVRWTASGPVSPTLTLQLVTPTGALLALRSVTLISSSLRTEAGVYQWIVSPSLEIANNYQLLLQDPHRADVRSLSAKFGIADAPPATCPDNCNGHGQCVSGVCHCNATWTGPSCADEVKVITSVEQITALGSDVVAPGATVVFNFVLGQQQNPPRAAQSWHLLQLTVTASGGPLTITVHPDDPSSSYVSSMMMPAQTQQRTMETYFSPEGGRVYAVALHSTSLSPVSVTVAAQDLRLTSASSPTPVVPTGDDWTCNSACKVAAVVAVVAFGLLVTVVVVLIVRAYRSSTGAAMAHRPLEMSTIEGSRMLGADRSDSGDAAASSSSSGAARHQRL